MRVADSGYFGTLGIPLLRGRNFSDSEQREAKHVILINEALARNTSPTRIRLDNGSTW